jgi:hypothetical protein
MKLFLILLFLYSCSQVPAKRVPEDDLVTVQTALDHIRSSYLKGCVDAFRYFRIPVSFERCRDQAKQHEKEVMSILLAPIYDSGDLHEVLQ